MSWFDRFRPPRRPGLRYSEEARLWARAHFAEAFQPTAAIVAGILCEQTGADFSELRASTRVQEMHVFDFFDTDAYADSIQREFGRNIPERDLEEMKRISDLVEYLVETAGGHPSALPGDGPAV